MSTTSRRRFSVAAALAFAFTLAVPVAADAAPKDDPLNGLWTATIDGKKAADDAQIESWTEIGVRLRMGGLVYPLTATGTALATTTPAPTYTDVLPAQMSKPGSDTTLTLTATLDVTDPSRDVIVGTLGTKSIRLERDTNDKPPIVLPLPGDRPYRMFLIELLAPAANRDRELYTKMKATSVGAFLKRCVLYKGGSWQYKYIKGTDLKSEDADFDKVIAAVDGLECTPRDLIGLKPFNTALLGELKNQSQAGLALTTFSMYFSTAAGRAVRLPIASDSTAYFITDRPSRSGTIGLVVMDTPSHGPLASTFGRQLLDMGAMTPADDTIYARTMHELLAKSDSSRAEKLSVKGRSALTDWFAVMAIEDYRGVAFADASLGWGYNMTNAQFYGLVVRALARPGEKDSKKKPIAGQVIVGTTLQPGDPSYADVLNGGNDMQEYPDMASLKTLATSYLKQAHPKLIDDVHKAFAGVVPTAELDGLATTDIFHFVCENLYDSQERIASLKGAKADAAVNAVTALFDQLAKDSAAFEAYILANGNTKSNDPAPKSTGF